MATDTPAPLGATHESLGERSRILVGALGATLEWYDFTLFIYLAPVLSHVFFPATDSYRLLETLGLFAAGFLTRPLGGVFFGRYGDRKGRKAALVLSMSFMLVPMLLTACAPSYARIGIWAPLLLLALRLAQGFSVGGEFGGSIVLLFEYASRSKKGYVSNVAQVTAGAGFLLSALGVALLEHHLSETAMEQWGWRALFLVGAVIGVGTLLAQLRMPETELFEQARDEGAVAVSPLRSLWTTARSALTKGFLLIGYRGMAFYLVGTFIPAWLTGELGRPASQGALVAVVGALLFTVLTPYAGLLSDHVGRKPPMVVAAALLIVVSYPLFLFMVHGGLSAAILSQIVLMTLTVVLTGASTPAVAELFDTPIRYSGVAIAYGLGVAVFGGTAPFLGDALVRLTGVESSPALLLIVGSALGLLLLWRLPETADRDP